MDAGLLRRHTWRHFLYEHTFFRAVHGEKLGLDFGELDADCSARHLAVLDDLVVNLRRRVDGQRKADALIAAGFTQDRGVDSDHVAVDGQQRSAAVAAVNGSVSLQKSLELMLWSAAEIALFRADDARR